MKDPETRNSFSKRAKRSDFHLNHNAKRKSSTNDIWTCIRHRGNEKVFEHDIRFQTEKVIGFQSIFLLRPSFPCMPVRFLSVNTALSAKTEIKKVFLSGKKAKFSDTFVASCGTQHRFRERINALLSFVSISWTLQKMIQRRRGKREFNLAIHLIGNCSGMICCYSDLGRLSVLRRVIARGIRWIMKSITLERMTGEFWGWISGVSF